MTHAPTYRLPHRALAALAFALLTSAQSAAAQAPPSDLPAVPPWQPAPAKAPPGFPGAPVTPGMPVAPPSTPPLPTYPAPSASRWPTPGELPPGYVVPGYYQAPYAGTPAIPLSDPYALPPLPQRRRHDTGLFVGGVLMVSGGMGLVLLGAYFVSSAAERIDIYCDTPSFPCAHKTDAARMTGGAVMMAVGTAAGAVGIPMWFIGSQYEAVPKDQRKAILVPEVRVGAGTASLRFRF